jgi:hypothetical protein
MLPWLRHLISNLQKAATKHTFAASCTSTLEHICKVHSHLVEKNKILSRSQYAMAYDRSSALESQPTNWRREDTAEFQDDPEFNDFSSQLSDKLFELTSNVSRLSTQIALLGTKRETERVRERVKDLIGEGSAALKQAGEDLKKVIQWEDVGVSSIWFVNGKSCADFQVTASATLHAIKTQPRIPSHSQGIPRSPTHSSR